jgi:transcription elongation factor Elf1
MSEVTCPRCHTRQPLEDPTGYRCAECGTAWMFVTCDNCGRRFHMRPGTTAWTCPSCGHEHGSATMEDLGPETAPSVPVTVVARHAAPPKAVKLKRPPTRGRLAALAVLGIAAVLVVSFALSSLGAEREAAAPPTSPATSTPAPTSVAPTEALCLHLRDLQTPREDALTRLAATLEGDSTAIAADGNEKLADAVLQMRVAVLAYRDALAAQGDTSAALAQVAAAYSQLPCGAGG